METNPFQRKTKGSPQQQQHTHTHTHKVDSKHDFRIKLFIHEELRAVQYDSASFKDVWELFGAIHLRCELENHPTIALPLSQGARIAHIAVHHCVQTTDFPLPTTNLTLSPPLGFCCKQQLSQKFDLFLRPQDVCFLFLFFFFSLCLGLREHWSWTIWRTAGIVLQIFCIFFCFSICMMPQVFLLIGLRLWI